MSKDSMFRTSAFGGFKKDDVMDFFEKVLNENSALENKLLSNDVKISQLNEEIASLKSKNDELESEISSIKESNVESSELSSKVDGYEKVISEKDALIRELSSKVATFEIAVDDKDTLIKELTERLSEANSKADGNDQLKALKAENERLLAELNKKHNIERQVGAAMLDARVHSEELVEQAREKADSVKKAVYVAIGDTAVKIDDLSAGIGEIARNFAKSVEEVELRIKALTGDMSKTAQALISDNILNDDIIFEELEALGNVEIVEDLNPIDDVVEPEKVEAPEPAEAEVKKEFLSLAEEIEALKKSKEYDFFKYFRDEEFNFDTKIGNEEY